MPTYEINGSLAVRTQSEGRAVVVRWGFRSGDYLRIQEEAYYDDEFVGGQILHHHLAEGEEWTNRLKLGFPDRYVRSEYPPVEDCTPGEALTSPQSDSSPETSDAPREQKQSNSGGVTGAVDTVRSIGEVQEVEKGDSGWEPADFVMHRAIETVELMLKPFYGSQEIRVFGNGDSDSIRVELDPGIDHVTNCILHVAWVASSMSEAIDQVDGLNRIDVRVRLKCDYEIDVAPMTLRINGGEATLSEVVEDGFEDGYWFHFAVSRQ